MRKRNNTYEEHFDHLIETMSAKDVTALINWGGHMYNEGVKDACKIVATCGLVALAVASIDYLASKKAEKPQETTRENPTI